VTVVAVPIGRGNWSTLRLQYAGPQLAPFTCRVGERFQLGGITWRVRAIEP
jgi:hypothetical protein